MPTSRRHDFDNSYSTGSFHNATAFSNAVIGDSYDLQAQSRGRDHRLLSQMNNVLHTDSPPTSSLLSSRSSKPRNISQLQPKTRRSTRLETSSSSEPFKSSRASDSFNVSKTAAPLKTSRQPVSKKLSKLSDALNANKLSFKHPTPSDSLNLPKPRDTLQLSKSSESSKKIKPSESLQLMKVPEFVKIPKQPESLQLTKLPDSLEVKKLAGFDRMSPVVEHARSLINRQRTFGTDSKLDNIATSGITLPRDLKSDFFTVSPLTKTRWPEKELADLPIPISIEEKPRKKKIYKNPYLDSDDEEYEMSVVQSPMKGRKTGELLKAMRNKKSSEYKTGAGSDMEDEDEPRGAYAINNYEEDEDEIETVKGKFSKKYEVDDSPNEVALSHLVSAAALRARAVLENLTGLLGKGGLVKVEGDIKPYGGELTTFRLHSPFHFQGPVMVGEKPVMSVGDDSFERYICRLQEKRKEERIQVEKDVRHVSKLNRALAIEPPKRYSLRPIGYISDPNYESFTKSLVPYKTGFDKTIISPSSKTVHFDEANAPRKLTLSRELVPFVPKGPEDEEMAVVPRKKRYPIYEYVEDIPVKMAIEFPRMDDDGDRERLSVLEKIRIKVSTDFRRPPKTAVAALRASRRPILASKPVSPRTTYHPKRKEVPATGPYYLSSLAGYQPGRTRRILEHYYNTKPNVVFLDSDEYKGRKPRSANKFHLCDPVYLRRRVAARPFYQHRYYLPWYAGWRAVARGRYLRSVPRIYYGRAYQLPEFTLKALLVGEDKLDDPARPRPRKPRTRYYADKLNKMDEKEQLSTFMATPPPTTCLKASKPPNPLPTYSWRAIREVDGYSRPANLMSWQYRIESRLEPDDLIIKPSGYGTMRDQVRGVQDKLDRHRQLLDRHANRLKADTGLGDSYAGAGGASLSAGRNTTEEGIEGLGKVSPLRKKLRKVICKSRHNPSYYDD